VTGAGGMLGLDAVDVLRDRGHQVTALSRTDLDVTDIDAVGAAIRGHDVVLNCAAWTAVDDAEEREGEAFLVNAVGSATLAAAARDAGALLVTVSTDYVFDGSATEPYSTDHPMRPVSAYGRTKAAGEWAVRAEAPRHLILRTAWLYGASGGCFPKTIARVASERGSVSVVADQHGQPTWTRDVADLAERLVAAGVTGTHHSTAGSLSIGGTARRDRDRDDQ
jgi:dTDP-4-dehydrorhamnose reductase